MDGVDPYFVSYLQGKIEVEGKNDRRWSTSDTAHFRMCMEFAYPDKVTDLREKVRFNREGHDNGEWDWKAQTEETFDSPDDYAFCRLAYSDPRLTLDGENGVRATKGHVDSSNMSMSVEFSRPLDIPVDDSITFEPNKTLKAWLSWGIFKRGKE